GSSRCKWVGERSFKFGGERLVVNGIRILSDRFSSMPSIMKIVCVVGLAAPILALCSGLQWVDAQNSTVSQELWQIAFIIALLVASAAPACLASVFMLVKRKIGIHIFPL